MRFTTLIASILAAVSAQSVGPPNASLQSGAAVVAGGTTQTISAIRTVVVAQVTQVVTVSVVVIFTGSPNTVIAIPTVVNGQTVLVAIPIANGTPVTDPAVVGSMTIPFGPTAVAAGNGTSNGTASNVSGGAAVGAQSGAAAGSMAAGSMAGSMVGSATQGAAVNGMPVITQMPTGSSATKILTGSLAIFATLIVILI